MDIWKFSIHPCVLQDIGPFGLLPKYGSDYLIYSRATPLIYIVMNREKEEEEETPIHYYGKGRGGTTVNDEVS